VEGLILIERLGRHGEVLERLRQRLAAGERLRIGRAWDADVLLDDPHVAAEHAWLRRDPDGRLYLDDAGSLNGVIDAESALRAESWPIDGRRTLRLGQTRLRILDGRIPVDAERPLLEPDRVGWFSPFALLIGSLGLSFLFDWMGQTGEFRSSTLLTTLLLGGLVMLGWSFAWSLLTRLFSGELRFLRHLRVVALGSIAASLLMVAVQYLSYNLTLKAIARFSFAGYWLLFAGVCWMHLHVLGPGHPRGKLAAMAGLAALAIGLQAMNQLQPRQGQPLPPRYVGNVVPPAFRLRPEQTEAEFLARAEALKAALDTLRSEEDGEDGDDGAAPL